mmetsp:Transcript_50664/g.101896  ORF Transcript_50664/g.101896 Transcript_50664/m.101896 type:complete len:89 (-) Transcript_50664:107-373(-)
MVHSKGPSHERGGEVFRLCPSGAPPPNGLSALSERCRYHRCCCLGVAFVEEEEEDDDDDGDDEREPNDDELRATEEMSAATAAAEPEP